MDLSLILAVLAGLFILLFLIIVQSWTMMTTLLAFIGLAGSSVVYLLG
jgi:hypothetical protein